MYEGSDGDSMTRRLTNNEFIERLAAANKTVEPLEKYSKMSMKIKVRCKTCGYTWEKLPQALLIGQGCPKCGRKKAAASMSETKRKKHDEFAQELASVNNKVKLVGEYTYAKNPVEVECVNCGRRWLAYPGNLLHGAGCKECANEQHRMSQDEFIKRLHEVNQNVELKSGYTMASNKADFKCIACGHEWSALPTSLLNGTGCPECRKKKLAEYHLKSHEEYARQFTEHNKTIKLIGQYRGSDNPIEVECLVCGHRWSTRAAHLLGHTGCPRCAGNMRYTHEQFIDKVHSINPNIQIRGKYVRGKDRIDVSCHVCGYEWSPKASALLVGQGCPRCAGVLKRTNQQFLDELANVNTAVTPLEEYDGADKSMRVNCNRCGHVWSVKPYALLRGSGCPQCATTRQSFFEHAILFAAEDALGKDNVVSHDKSAIGMELDVYIPSIKVAFEPGSWYYHKVRVDVDKVKQDKCGDVGIKLYTIYSAYTEDSPAPEWSISTPLVLGSFEWGACRKMIETLFAECAIDTSNVNWSRVYRRSIVHGGRRTTEGFIDEMGSINPNIEVVGEYSGSRNRIEVRCKKCGHEWSPTAGSLLSGIGCPVCMAINVGNRNRKTHDQYVSEVAKADPNIEVVGKYIGYDYNVDVRCKVCGYEWRPRAGYILNGHHCPRCNNKLRRTHDSFIRDVSKINPDVQVVGKYVNYTTYIKVKCLVCGNEWETAAGNILAGRGCPKCGLKKSAKSRNKTHEKFVTQLSDCNPDIEAIGRYNKAREKMEFKCRKCGHTWYATPDNILRGRGCPKCKYDKMRKITLV